MAFETTIAASADSHQHVSADAPASNSGHLRAFVFALFFAFGGITSLNDVLIPKLKALFSLTYGEVMLVQFAFFAAYFIISIPAAALVRRIGYMRSAAVGLLAMTAGCLLFVPASSNGIFGLFLLALFVLAAGITTVQVVANPLISMLGPSATASSRLTFAQAFNSLGTTIFPYVGSMLILGSLATVDPATLSGAALDAFRGVETRVIAHTYLGLAVALALLAVVVWVRRKALVEIPADTTPILRAFNLLARPRFAFGTACIFLYVGGEVAIGSLIVSYLMQSSVLGVAAEEAGKHVPFYWGGAMVGRFIGAYVLRLFAPGKVLACVAVVVISLLFISANSMGTVSAWSLLAIGLFNSIMFPTIFSLASEGLGKRTAEGSGVICMAIVGGAIVPLIAGKAADLWSLKAALCVPAVCYGGILAFGWFARRPLRVTAET
ncbi:MAG TPA: sugar MFS transporter [Steroidobacteraceae bacterium]|jgi:FHS family L-fucose permease-like MFS transporter|nr:sugar MFS transporter [Steroidobacteraceae bacterium]